ncbi:hypothetical protein KM927_27510 [Priestia megaterium]|uniref:hypothetical protein n=1 Tax=Priestia megaterium TaxID=1404 RepID=UPI001C21EF69|nr:hypothetical protein [Priestia megaterium]MBU8757220.1 hypothetical protein [Priestia megaterium]
MKKNAFILFYTYIIFGFLSYMKIPYNNIFYQSKFIIFGISFGLLFLLTYKCFLTNKKLSINKILLFLLYLWLIFMISSMFINFTGFNGAFFALSLVFVLFFSLILLPKNHNVGNLDTLLSSFLKILLFTTLFSIIYSLVGFTPKSYIDPSTFRDRYTFGFSNANYLGMVSFLGITLSILLFSIRKKILYLASLSIFVYTVIASDSRTALWSALLWGFTFITFKLINKPQVQIVLAPALILVALILTRTKLLTYEKIDELSSYRLTNWTILTKDMNHMELIFGKGIGISASDLANNTTFDNFFVGIFVQSGIIGSVLLVTILSLIFIKIIRLKDTFQKRIAVSFYLSWILYSVFESSFISLSNPISIIIWMIIGVTIAPKSAQ